ncbi:hypothetical protein HK096_005205 [Nowakowskiella sp. JEL0078]|nr:hypothetical protein HK096_005205 [Nowakowskiella sp. JEL0078]
MTISSTDIAISALTAIVGTESSLIIPHARIGVAIFGMVITSVVLGQISAKRGGKIGKIIYFLVAFHSALGWGTFILGIVNCVIGLQLLKSFLGSNGKYLDIAIYFFYAYMLVCVVISIFFCEPPKWIGSRANWELTRFGAFEKFRKRYLSYKVLSVEVENTEMLKERQEYFMAKIGRNLPSFRWEEIRQKATDGAQWLVMDGIVFDVEEYIAKNRHPAGQRPILKYIGTDITSVFYGISLIKQTTFSNQPDDKGKHNEEHQHSRFAHWEISQLAIGILRTKQLDAIDNFSLLETRFPRLQKKILKAHLQKTNSRFLSENRFHMFKFVSKMSLRGHQATRPLFMYRFTRSEKCEDVLKFLPGDFVTIQFENNDKIQRIDLYLCCTSQNGNIDLIAENYLDWIDDLNGGSINIRGPIASKHNLLHPAQKSGCYPMLLMFAQSAGISGIWILLQYYLEYGFYEDPVTFSRKPSKIFLVLYSHSDSDALLLSFLVKLERLHHGRFKCIHVVEKIFAKEWKGLIGTNSSIILQKILEICDKFEGTSSSILTNVIQTNNLSFAHLMNFEKTGKNSIGSLNQLSFLSIRETPKLSVTSRNSVESLENNRDLETTTSSISQIPKRRLSIFFETKTSNIDSIHETLSPSGFPVSAKRRMSNVAENIRRLSFSNSQDIRSKKEEKQVEKSVAIQVSQTGKITIPLPSSCCYVCCGDSIFNNETLKNLNSLGIHSNIFILPLENIR